MKPIKVLLAILGVDQHEVGAMVVMRLLRDAGMEVVYGGRYNLPPTIVNTALEEDVDVIGLSCHSWEFREHVPKLIALLKEAELDIPVVVGGSVITTEDKAELEKMGVAKSFGSTATNDEIVQAIHQLVRH